MKKFLVILSMLMLMAACSEPYDLKTRSADRVFLCVEAPLTNMPSVQTVRLTESVDYQSTKDVPAVSGAEVTVSDGDNVTVFTERPGSPGHYDSPKNFYCKSGKNYRLSIDCKLSTGKSGHYEADSEMAGNGFDIEKIDYKYLGPLSDSTWVVGIWGTDKPQTSYFIVTTAVNGQVSPTTSLLERSILMPDTYFNGGHISGFPIGFMYQNANQMKKYGPCAKPLEKGDIVSLVVYTMTKGYYDFVMALSASASSMSVPIISSQPANIPSNIRGEDAVGFFATCPVMIASCIVDDPFRMDFKQ